MRAPFALAFALLCPPLPAAGYAASVRPYGSGTAGTGGFVPRAWVDGHPSPGSSFRFTVSNAVGAAPAFFVLGSRPGSLRLLGFDLLVDPTAPVFLVAAVGPLTGTPGKGGEGSGQVPLTIPSDPGLVGAQLYAQWIVHDTASSSNLVASDGVAVTVVEGPLAVAGGSRLLHTYVPPSTNDASQAFAGNPDDVQLSPDGKLCFVAGRLSDSVHIYDATVRPMRSLAQTALPPAVNSLAVHPDGHTIYVISAHATAPAISVVDVRPSSSTFGQVLRAVTGLPTSGLGDMEGISMSDNRRTIVVAVMGLVGTRSILVIDAIPTREQFVKQIPIQVAGYLTDVDVSADGLWAYGCLAQLGPGSNLVRVFIPTGQVQNNVAFSGDFAADVDLDPRGRFLVTANPNSSNLTVFDLTPGPGFLAWRHLQSVASARFFSCALTPDGSQVVGASQGPNGFVAWDIATGSIAWNKGMWGSGTSIAVR